MYTPSHQSHILQQCIVTETAYFETAMIKTTARSVAANRLGDLIESCGWAITMSLNESTIAV